MLCSVVLSMKCAATLPECGQAAVGASQLAMYGKPVTSLQVTGFPLYKISPILCMLRGTNSTLATLRQGSRIHAEQHKI